MQLETEMPMDRFKGSCVSALALALSFPFDVLLQGDWQREGWYAKATSIHSMVFMTPIMQMMPGQVLWEMCL